jgi:C1A family cysteine protease
MTLKHSLGWVRDLPDHRDYMFAAPSDVLTTLPPKVDLRPLMPPVYDQKAVGSCTAQAIGAAIQYERVKAGQTPDFIPSRLMVYWNERLIERTVPIDAGAMLRDGIKTVAKQGVCDETNWPYIPVPADPQTNIFPPGSPPISKAPQSAYTAAMNFRVNSYLRVIQTLIQLKGCLAQGHPIIFGFTVYTNIYGDDGEPVTLLTVPRPADRMLGGHAVLAVGYDDDRGVFIIRNSWGDAAQDHGYFYMAYPYITDQQLASDFWTIRGMSS